MDSWDIAPHGAHDTQRGLPALVASIGDEGFAEAALHSLNAALRAASWSVYQVWRDRPPVLHLSSSLGVADTTTDCFGAYRDGLYRRDRSFECVRHARPGHATVLRMSADDAPNADHRDIIYRRHRMLERLSVARLEGDGSLLAVNLYHHEHQGPFCEAEMHSFDGIAPVLLASVQRHIALSRREAAPERSSRERLSAACPSLTPRELDVCERLLRGWSYDGVAADMRLSVATVKTYRARAFERLGIHFRSELFARFAGAAADGR